MKDPVLQAIETAKWCDDAVLDPTIKTPTMTYIHGANRQIEAIRSAYLAERQRLEQRIAELNAVIDEVRIACDEGGCMIGTKYCDFISSQTSRIAELEQLLFGSSRKRKQAIN